MKERKSITEIGLNGILLITGLYEEVPYDRKNPIDIFNLILQEIKIDCYCVSCKKERIFTSESTQQFNGTYNKALTYRADSKTALAELYFSLLQLPMCFSRNFKCSMSREHQIDYWFSLNNNYIVKAGQIPSLADMAVADIRKYSKILSQNDLSDFSKGIGLHAHGVGAGAFVYLRRVFESLIEKAYKNCQEEHKWDSKNDFSRIDMKAKIDLLEEYLPQFIYNNKPIYGVLSAGIHSLEEEYCKEKFNILKEAIFVILDQEIRRKEDAEREIRISKGINQIVSEIHENS